MNKKENIMKTIVVTQQEITMATRPNVYRFAALLSAGFTKIKLT